MSREVEIEEILTWPELQAVREELSDPRYLNNTHGARSTFSRVGCRGPLCARAQAVGLREYKARKKKEQGLPYAAYDVQYPMGELLDAIIEWHKEKRQLLRLLRKADKSRGSRGRPIRNAGEPKVYQ